MPVEETSSEQKKRRDEKEDAAKLDVEALASGDAGILKETKPSAEIYEVSSSSSLVLDLRRCAGC